MDVELDKIQVCKDESIRVWGYDGLVWGIPLQPIYFTDEYLFSPILPNFISWLGCGMKSEDERIVNKTDCFYHMRIQFRASKKVFPLEAFPTYIITSI